MTDHEMPPLTVKPPRSALHAYSALVLGSTGNVGREIVNLLSASSAVTEVVVVNRRLTDAFKTMPKVREVVVPDIANLAASAASAAREAGATVGFCTIGVGKGSRQMPAAEVRKVEVRYPEAFAKGCKAGGVLCMGFMTAAGADSKSAVSYVRIIGEKEKAVIDAGIPTLLVYKPSVILGNTNTPSYLGYVFPALQWILPSRYHAIHKIDLARAMFEGTQNALAEMQQTQARGGASPAPAVRYYEYADMKALFSTDDRNAKPGNH